MDGDEDDDETPQIFPSRERAPIQPRSVRLAGWMHYRQTKPTQSRRFFARRLLFLSPNIADKQGFVSVREA